MQLQVYDNSDQVAQQAANFIARFAEQRIAAHDRFLLAVSGGSTPWKMLSKLADSELRWNQVSLFQTDERIAPSGDPRRNLVQIEKQLLGHCALKKEQIIAMPVEQPDAATAARQYAEELKIRCGDPPVLDLVHLGLGEDGHTASLLPQDPVLASSEVIAVSESYQGLRRMTMTYSIINNALYRLWIITGANKRPMLERLIQGDETIPAGKVARENTLIMADEQAAEGLTL